MMLTCRQLVPLLLLALAGCTTEIVTADYALTIVPHRLLNQQPFDGAPAVTLRAYRGPTQLGEWPAGNANGELTLPSMPPFEAGTTLALAIAGDPPRAWGEAELPVRLADDGATLTLDMLVARTDTIGDLGSLNANQTSVGASLALMPNGRALLFGGARSASGNDSGRRRVLVLDQLDSADWSMRPSIDMPPIFAGAKGDTAPGRVFATATQVIDEGVPRVLVTGGRNAVRFPDLNSRSAFIYDPERDEVVWQADQALNEARSEHRAIPLLSGDVLIVAGWTGEDANTVSLPTAGTIELYDAATRTFRRRQSAPGLGIAGVAATSLGPSGAMICGGVRFTNDDSFQPVDACYIVELDGDLVPIAPLPTPTTHLALAQLPNGTVLATGGITATTSENQAANAQTTAWIWTPSASGGAWAPTARMQAPRAMHALQALPDGTVLAVGGVSAAAPFGVAAATPAPQCSERYFPETGQFGSLPLCSTTGAGAHPSVVYQPGQGVIVHSGYWNDPITGFNGGQTYGFIATPAPR